MRLKYMLSIMIVGLAWRADAQAMENPFKDTSVLAPPTGSSLAVVVFEDLACPGCARAHALESQIAKDAGIPLIRLDYPIPAHTWSFQAAVNARYLRKHATAEVEDSYRLAVLNAQFTIANGDDLQRFTKSWMKEKGIASPKQVDPDGSLAAEVRQDYDRGEKLNLQFTPTIVVVARDRYEIVCGAFADQDTHSFAEIVSKAKSNPSSLRYEIHGAHALLLPEDAVRKIATPVQHFSPGR